MKKFFGFLLALLSFGSLRAQTTAIPDSLFEQALIDLGLDNSLDGSVATANIDTLKKLKVINKNINSLSGIEDFSALTQLRCWGNNLSSINLTQNTSLTYLHICCNNLLQLDVSQNTALTYLRCDGNSLDSLDVTNNLALTYLNCGSNNISSLDVTQNTQLRELLCRFLNLSSLDISNNILLTDLYCNNNQLSTLDLSSHSGLVTLLCQNNQLTSLNVKNGNNHNFHYVTPPQMGAPYYTFFADNNPMLNCIQVDDSTWSTTRWTRKDPHAVFRSNCNYPSTTNIEESHLLQDVSIYPNPSKGEFTLSIKGIQEKLTVSLRNALGEVLYTEQFLSPVNQNLELNYPVGIYFLTIRSEKGEVKVFKIAKE